MSIRRVFALIRAVSAVPRIPGLVRPTSSLSVPWYCNSSSGFNWKKHQLDFMLGVILSGQTVIFLGSNGNSVLAQDDSVAEVVNENDQVQAYVTDLQRIEDGSVISNVHTSKWRVYTDNGRDLFLKGKLDDAEKFFRAALDEAKMGFGPKDPHVASSCNNLAELYRVKKEYEKAEPLYLEAISILEDTYGADDVRVGAALHNLGQFYFALRKVEQARQCYERSLKIKGRVLGYGHTDYADTMYHFGRVLHLQGKEKEAEDLIRQSIRILEEAGLGESTTCIRRMRYLAQILINSNRLNEAENYQRKILHVFELSKGWDSIDTVIAAENLALTLQSLGNLNEAEELLERCLAGKEKILSKNHVQVAVSMLHLARLSMLKSRNLRKVNMSEARDEIDKAKLLLNSSIRIAKDNLGLLGTNQKSSRSKRPENVKEHHVALIILIQSLDSLGLLEVKKQELGTFEYPFEVEHALRECISIFNEPSTRSMVFDSSNIKGEYLSCLKHLVGLASTSMEESQKSRELKEIVDEAKNIEAKLSTRRH